MKKIISKLVLITLFISFFAFGIPANAASASLYLAPSTGTYAVGAKFSVSIRINTGGVAINAAQGELFFDKDILKVTGISTGGSIFNLWTTQPAFNNGAGTVSFAGGVPHPGYTGSNGVVCTVSFQTLKAGAGGFRFTSGFVLANDGKGTNILSSMGSGSYTVSPKQEAPKQEAPKQEAPVAQPKTNGQAITPKEEKPVEKATYNEPKVTSETHPDQNKWFSGSIAKLKWEMPEGVEGVSFSLDKEENADPGSKADGLFDAKEYPIEKDGHWFFHIKFQDNKNRWGTVSDFRINSDNTPPKDFEIQIIQEDPTDWPILKFETSDELSGIDRYEIFIDDLQTEAIVKTSDDPTYKAENLDTGKHTAIVKAFDRANNEKISTIDFLINTLPAPEIKNYSSEIKPGSQLFMSGTSIAETVVTLFIQKENEESKSYIVNADKDGNWFLASGEEFTEGQYVAWAKAKNAKGLESAESTRVSFLVTPPIFAKVGSFVVNYFTVLVSLLFMIILIILLLLFLFETIRKKLRKETLEIEKVLEKNLANAKTLINMEINTIKMSSLDKERLKNQMKNKIDEAKNGILKEVKDVEKILK